MNTKKIILISALISILFSGLTFYVIKSYSQTDNDSIFNDSNILDENYLKTIAHKQELINQITTNRNNIITETVKTVSPAVVGINVTEVRQFKPYANDPFLRYFYGDIIQNREIKGFGSGFIISPDGYVLTNDHVAGNATKIIVTMTDGSKHDAQIIGSDKVTDICLLKINGNNFPFIKFSELDDLLIGEWSIAIGNPFGLFEINDKPTVTVGVISSTGMNLGEVEGRYYLDMIQTDASINRGNSGGPLVNVLGELIGINTIIYSPNYGDGSVGVGFAIPSTKIKRILKELKENGKIDRDFWTGIYYQNIDDNIAKYYKLSKVSGVLIANIDKNSPADKANLKSGDIILKLGKYNITNVQILIGALQEYKADEIVEMSILRDSKTINIKMKLERRK